MLTLTKQEFQFLQSLTNEMYQTDFLRSGPMGDMIISIRNKFLSFGSIDLSDSETRFMLYVINDVFTTSQSPIVQSQLGLTMKFLGDREPKLVSSISQINTSTSDEMSMPYLTMWQIMTNVMTKLGLAPPAPYVQPAFGPTGDPGGISTNKNINPDDRST